MKTCHMPSVELCRSKEIEEMLHKARRARQNRKKKGKPGAAAGLLSAFLMSEPF